MKNWIKQAVTTTGATSVSTALALGSAASGLLALRDRYADGATISNQTVTDDTGSGINRMVIDGTLTYGTPDTFTITRIREKVEGGTLTENPASGLTLSGAGSGGIAIADEPEALSVMRGADLVITTPGTVDANQTGVVGEILHWDLTSITAVRDFNLPGSFEVGDRCGLLITGASASYAARMMPAAGDTVDGGSAGAEFDRYFQVGELAIFRGIAADSAWVCEQVRKVYCNCRIDGNGGSNQSMADVTWVTMLGTLLANVVADNANMADVSNGRINIRRSGKYAITIAGTINDTCTGNLRIKADGPSTSGFVISPKSYIVSDQPIAAMSATAEIDIGTDGHVVMVGRHATGGLRSMQASNGTFLEVREVP